jgi:Raf kinase inhibitor-like YbhB/YbcL family protein
MYKEMTISSASFENQNPIPSQHTCEGSNQSPPLAWKNLPPNTKSLALIMEDPDAPQGTFVHWVMWNIDPRDNELPAHLSPDIYNQGVNSDQGKGYMGPCPPSGQHRYYFYLYALDEKFPLPADTTKTELLESMKGHILGEAKLMGTYQKKSA